ncbi:hypothetical protein HDU97_006645 [Phlyctochytrium planicorne]|nr:hypothetical protein HDU97_006645 [Phlyctochytrium planicorne]
MSINPASLNITTPTDPAAPFYFGLDQNSNGFMISMAGFVFIMTPGLGFFYSGMTRSKNALTMIMLCMMAMCVVSIQWICFGFSLAFSEYSTDPTDGTKGSAFIGNFNYAGFQNVGLTALIKTAPSISSVVFAFYQMQFATITAALIFGSVAERIRILPAMIFVLFWTTFVYDFAAYATWSYRGWIRNMACIGDAATTPCLNGSLDFAGGGPVHVASGFAGLAFCLVLGKRRRVGQEEFKPHNLANVFLGTALLWFGWYGFNGGSALAGTARAGMAALVTHVATAAGALAWPTFDYFWSRKVSGLGFCSGAVAALVAVTPASGFVAPWAGIVIGICAGVICNLACRVKGFFGFDDSLDAWGVHGVGGFLGNILTGIFAQKWVASLDGTILPDGSIPSGAIDGNAKQIGYQFAGSAAIAAYSFIFTYVFLTAINFIPGLHLRPSEDDEILGGDLSEMGEVAYELVSSIAEPFPEMTSDKTQNTIVV